LKARKRAASFVRIVVAGGLLVIFLVGAVIQVQAHATYLRSEPADNSVVVVPPSVIKIWYTEPIAANFSTAQLLDLSSKQIPVRVEYDSGNPTLMIIIPPTLANGVYTLNWLAASASDGHQSRGYIVFRVGEETVAETGAEDRRSSDITSLSIPEGLLRWFNYLGLMLMVGAIGVTLVVLRPGEKTLESFFSKITRRVFAVAALAAAVVFADGLLYLAWQISSLMANQNKVAPGIAVTQVLFGTSWGAAWIARQGFTTALIPIFTFLAQAVRPHKLWIELAGMLSAAALAAQALTSHAAGGNSPELPVAVDFLHLVFVSLWVGGLLCLSVAILPFVRKEQLYFKQIAGVTWGRFSPLAALSVGMVIATGVYSTGQRVISADALLLTTYGLILAGKVALMLLAGLFGLVNSLMLHPGLAAPFGRLFKKPVGWIPFGDRRLPSFIITEAFLGVMIALVVGGLTTMAPASDIQYAISPGQQPDRMIAVVSDLIIGLSIKPDHPGPNILDIMAASTLRPAPAEVLRVIVNMTYLEQDFGTVSKDAAPVGATAYQTIIDSLTQPGRWKIAVVVRRKGIPDTEANFTWTVLPVGAPPTMLVSRIAWKEGLSLLAALMGGVVLVIGVFVHFRRQIIDK